MSLLSKKSWDPRSAKNRARVERDERELAEEESQRRKRTQEIEANYYSERLKKDAKKQTQGLDSSTGKHVLPPPKKFRPSVSTWGNVTKGLVPWYARKDSENARPIDARSQMIVSRDNIRDDPFTQMEIKEAEIKKSESRLMRLEKNTSIASSLLQDKSQMKHTSQTPEKGQIEMLREERLRREREEREKANRLLAGRRGGL